MDSSSNDIDLVSIAKSEGPGVRLDNIEKFILDLQVTASNTQVDGQIIYWVYLKWCKEKKKKHLNRYRFFEKFKIRFERVNASRKKRYKVDPGPFQIDEKDWWAMREHFRREVERRRRREEKKRQRKREKSGTQETV